MGTGSSYDTTRHASIQPLAVTREIENPLDDFAVSEYLQVSDRCDKGRWSAV
jgi:hypothetical protein